MSISTQNSMSSKPQQILTEQEFNKSVLKNLMSYDEYFSTALKSGSAFTIAREMTLQKAEETSDDIRQSVEGWYIGKEQEKDKAEKKYYAALEQYNLMKSSQDKALSRLTYTTNIYGEESTQYADALKKYNLSSKTLFGADVNLGIARDKFNFANFSAFNAYLSTRI